MVNHSAAPSAYYDEEPDGSMTLQIRPSSSFQHNAEVCISYGKAKPAAEMLFSWGFIDEESSSQKFTLPIEPFSDDPLAKAKLHIFDGSPTVSFALEGSECHWASSFVYLMCLNEEDGLEFRVLQDFTGERQLKLFWQEEDVTEKAGGFADLIEDHPLRALFELRAVAVLQEAVADQVERLESAPGTEQLEPLIDAEIVERDFVEIIATLKRKEAGLLAAAASTLELQVGTHSSQRFCSQLRPRLFPRNMIRNRFKACNDANVRFVYQKQQLLEDEAVVTYLGSTEAAQNEQAASSPANGDVDFS